MLAVLALDAKLHPPTNIVCPSNVTVHWRRPRRAVSNHWASVLDAETCRRYATAGPGSECGCAAPIKRASEIPPINALSFKSFSRFEATSADQDESNITAPTKLVDASAARIGAPWQTISDQRHIEVSFEIFALCARRLASANRCSARGSVSQIITSRGLRQPSGASESWKSSGLLVR